MALDKSNLRCGAANSHHIIKLNESPGLDGGMVVVESPILIGGLSG